MGLSMPYLNLSGVDLWYDDAGGDGTPVVLMHAASGTSESWLHQVPAFTAAGYRCIAFDRRGWGRSRPTASGEQPGCASDDLHGLAEALELDRFHLVGTAAGAAPSVDYALSHPNRLRSLVISTCTGGAQDPEHLDLLERIRPPEFQALPVVLREVSPGYRATNLEGTKRWVEIAESTHEATAARHRARNRVTYASLETLRLPVLAIAGGADQTTPPVVVRAIASHIPGCRFELMSEAGHAAFWEQPEVWNRLVLDFIAQH